MRKFVILLSVVMMATAGAVGAPLLSGAAAARADTIQPAGSVPIPIGPAPNWIVADLDTGKVLAESDGYAPHPPASTIKVLLALVALDELALDSTVTATPADTQVECNCVGIEPGRSYSTRQLLEALMLTSGNDAANTLASMFGGPDKAVTKMNAKAVEVGALDTIATTPSGLDGAAGPGQTTPRDLAVILRAALAKPAFAEITAERSAMFPYRGGERPIVNSNELLTRYPGAVSGKTGFTDAARKTYVGAAARDGRRLVVAMMYGLIREGGPTYWDQAATLLDWGFLQDSNSGVGVL